MRLEKIVAREPLELFNILNSINITVPPKSEGRKTDDAERWSIVRFLLTMLKGSNLDFPLSLVHRDRPDFELATAKMLIGIEVTEAVPKQMAWAQVLFETNFPNGLFEPDLFKWDSPERSKEEILALLEKCQDKLQGSGWIGNSVETEWSKAMNDCVNYKIKKIHNPEFKKYPTNYLLIYDNLPQALNNLKLASDKLSEHLSAYWDNAKSIMFDRIVIESGKLLVEFSEYGHSIIHIPESN